MRRVLLAILKFSGLAIFAALTLAYVAFEARNIRWALLEMRLESNCRDPKVDIEACGQLALRRLYHPTSEDRQREGRAMLETLCKNGSNEGCRNVAYAGESWMLETLEYRDWQTEVTTTCERDGGVACLAWAYALWPERETLEKIRPRCHRGDWRVCAAVMYAEHELDTSSTNASQHCKAGIQAACETLPALATWTTPATDATCETSPEGCFADGLRKTVAVHADWRANGLARDDIAATFGKACDAGVGQGCWMAGVAELNRPIGAAVDLSAVAAYWDKGCTQGEWVACWHRATMPDLDASRRHELLERVCRDAPRVGSEYVGACDALGRLWMAQQKITPWVMDWGMNFWNLRQTCESTRERGVCQQLAENIDANRGANLPAFAPLTFTAWSAASIGCAKHRDDACVELVDISLAWPYPSQQSVESLGESVCAKVPKVCPAFEQRLERWRAGSH